MTAFTFSGGTATIGTTEFSVANNATYSSASPMVTQGNLQVLLDLSAMAAGDQFQVRLYEKVNGGTQRPISTAVLAGAQGELYVLPALLVGEGWDVTLKKLAGTDRAIGFSLRQDVADASAVAAAVWATISEGTETVAHAIRLMRARLMGKATVQDGDGTYTYRDRGDTKNRIVMARSGSARTTSSTDGT